MLLSGRPVQTGQVLFEFKFSTAQSDLYTACSIATLVRHLEPGLIVWFDWLT